MVQNKTIKYTENHYKISWHNFVQVSMQVNFKISCHDKSHIFSFKIVCKYHGDISCIIDMSKINGLATVFATDTTWYDSVQKRCFFRCRRSAFKWSSRSRIPTFLNGIYGFDEMTHAISIICGVRMVPKNRLCWQVRKWAFQKRRLYIAMVLFVSVSNYTALKAYDDR